jgi:hypothetical protein
MPLIGQLLTQWRSELSTFRMHRPKASHVDESKFCSVPLALRLRGDDENTAFLCTKLLCAQSTCFEATVTQLAERAVRGVGANGPLV